jgi:hypothetical protein
MKRQKDVTPVECKLCGVVVPASGIPSHLYHKHDKLSSNEYVEKYGEFRQKHLKNTQRLESSKTTCQICNTSVVSNKQLLYHIKSHKIDWKDYYVKYYFNGVHPTCSCGCGAEVKLLRHGKNEKGEPTFARDMLPGHCNHQPGYRYNTPEQKETMRRAAIKRMEEGKLMFNPGPTGPEKVLVETLRSWGIHNIIQSEREILAGLELDIYLPDFNLAIEVNGNRFHSDLFKKRNYHLKKTEECARKGIRLIHIWECDFRKKQDILLSNLKSILNLTETRIYARECKIQEVTAKQASEFLKKNHLQGPTVAKIRLGLFKEGRLVSLMTFSKLRKAVGMTHKEGSYELARYCTELGTTNIGGASRLFKHFIRSYNPKYVMSFANRDWSIGNMYSKLGMQFTGYTPPGYFYVKSQFKYSRFAFTKHKLVEMGYDKNKTEYEIMTEQGYFRIWDCGNLKYEWAPYL